MVLKIHLVNFAFILLRIQENHEPANRSHIFANERRRKESVTWHRCHRIISTQQRNMCQHTMRCMSNCIFFSSAGPFNKMYTINSSLFARLQFYLSNIYLKKRETFLSLKATHSIIGSARSNVPRLHNHNQFSLWWECVHIGAVLCCAGECLSYVCVYNKQTVNWTQLHCRQNNWLNGNWIHVYVVDEWSVSVFVSQLPVYLCVSHRGENTHTHTRIAYALHQGIFLFYLNWSCDGLHRKWKSNKQTITLLSQ